ncbi:Glutamate-tRNA ligase, partial [human gut metagenome]
PADPDWQAHPLVSAASFGELSAREQEVLTAAAPLIQTRVQLLGEARDMLGFLFVSDDALQLDEKAVSKLKDSAPAVLDAAIATLEPLTQEQWTTERLG